MNPRRLIAAAAIVTFLGMAGTGTAHAWDCPPGETWDVDTDQCVPTSQTTVPETTVPETTVPDTAPPVETTVPEVAPPVETTVPDTAAPVETKAPAPPAPSVKEALPATGNQTRNMLGLGVIVLAFAGGALYLSRRTAS
jgi:LPXTG-motif cell wall-anchored protein